MATTTKTTLFETGTCGRCGGSGHYSYNQMNGTTCFGCNGSGLALTRKGKAQSARFRASLQRPVEDVKVGEFIRVDGRFRKVLAIEAVENYGSSLQADGTWKQYSGVEFTTAKVRGRWPLGDCKIESVRDEAHRQELIRAALAG